MFTDRLVASPTLYLAVKPQLHIPELQAYFEANNLSDIPKLESDTPVGRFYDHFDDINGGYEVQNEAAELAIELGGRICYGSFGRGRNADDYHRHILETGHGSVLAHAQFGFIIQGVSRSLTHELVRHAQGVAISQESQRFVSADSIRFVVPPALLRLWDNDLECPAAQKFLERRMEDLDEYREIQDDLTDMIRNEMDESRKTLIRKRANEAARSVLPNAAETQGVWTINFRALRYIIGLRGAEDADLEIRRFASELALQAKFHAPKAFYDVEIGEKDEFGVHSVNLQHRKP